MSIIKLYSKFVLKTIDLYLEVDSRLRPITLYKHQKGTVQPLLLATKVQRESIFFEVKANQRMKVVENYI